jgi:protein-tyrosine phosphatase
VSANRPAVLFVCLGNICRSPLAEAAFRLEAERVGLDVEIDSAGTADWHVGKAPDPRSVAVAREAGIDIAHLTARQVVQDDFRRFDHIFALDRKNLADLTAMMPPDSTAQVSLLLQTMPDRKSDDVDDPYYGSADAFAFTWTHVSQAARSLAKRLARS